MEEVDKIILDSLVECGCDFAEQQSSISEFSTENIVEAAVRCLRIINPQLKMSHSLPPGMSARFRVGTALAQACQSAGYRGDIGYQTFLYLSEADIRRLFMFLVERLPRKKDEAVEQSPDKGSAFHRNVACILKEQLSSFWLPPYCKKNGVRWSQNEFSIEGTRGTSAFYADLITVSTGVGREENPSAKDLPELYQEETLFIHEQLSHHSHLMPSLMENNVSMLSKQQAWEDKLKSVIIESQLSPKELVKQKVARPVAQRRITTKSGNVGTDCGVMFEGFSLNGSLESVANLISAQSSALASSVSIAVANSDFEIDTSKNTTSSESTMNRNMTTVDEILEQKETDSPELVENHVQVENGDVEKVEDEILKETEEETIRRVETKLKTELKKVVEKMEQMDLEVHKFQEGIIKAKSDFNECSKSNQTVQEKVKLQKKTLQLLPDAESNMAKLVGMVEVNKRKISSLSQQWEKHRAPLQERFDEMKEQSSQKATQSERKLKEVKLVRLRIKECTEEMKRKEQLGKQLTTQLADRTKDVSRKSYTKRIFEIVANIRKQKQEIERALTDMRSLQKELNQLEGRVERTFTAADDLFFMDARSDDSVCQSYKYLASLNLNCSQLLCTVEQTGEVMREIRDLEEQVSTESKKNTVANLNKITKDFKDMKKENAEMMRKLKSMATSPNPGRKS